MSYWNRLEDRLREAIRNAYRDEWTMEGPPNHLATIYLIDEILADETGRGTEYDKLTDDQRRSLDKEDA